MNKLLYQLFWSVLLLSLITACTNPINSSLDYQKARSGLENLMRQLPQSEKFNVIKTIKQEFSHTGGEKTCYYARAHLIIGTSMPETESLDIYEQSLKTLNWVPREQQYKTSRVLYYGNNDRMVVTSGEPGVDVKDLVDYEQLRKTYKSIIFVSIDYMLPNREEC
jgi:hypothetical protein